MRHTTKTKNGIAVHRASYTRPPLSLSPTMGDTTEEQKKAVVPFLQVRSEVAGASRGQHGKNSERAPIHKTPRLFPHTDTTMHTLFPNHTARPRD